MIKREMQQANVNRRRTTLLNMVFSCAQFSLALVSGIVLVPIYLKYIPVGLYGSWLATGSVVVWLTVLDPGVANLLMQKVAEANGNRDHQKICELITCGLLIVFIIALSVIFVGICVGPYVIDWLNIRSENEVVQNAFVVAVISSAFMVVYYSVNAINYAFHSSMAIGIIYNCALLFKIILIVVLLRSGAGLLSLPYGELISAGIMIIASLVLLGWNLRQSNIHYIASFKGGLQFFKLFIYTFMARLSKIATKSVDNVFISIFLSPEIVVVYNLTNKVPMTTENMVKLPIAAFRPALSHAFGAGEVCTVRVVISRLIRIIFWTTGVLVAGFLAFNDDFVRLWVGEDLFAGSVINALVCLVFILNVWTNVIGMLLFSQGGIKPASLSDSVSSLIVIPLMFVGIHYLGLPGLLLGHIFTMLITGFWYLPISLFKILNFPKSEISVILKELVLVASATVLMFVCFRAVGITGWCNLVGYSCLAAIIYASILLLFSLEFRMEINRLCFFLLKWKIYPRNIL